MILMIKIASSIIAGFFAGPAAVYVFNHMPERWLCEYGETPKPAEQPVKRIKENPWRWIYSAGFICLCLRLSTVYDSTGTASVRQSVESAQIAAAGLIICWIMLIIALADLKYMIIPDQFVLMLAISSIGFMPLWDAEGAAAAEGIWQELTGFWQPLLGMVIGGGAMLMFAAAGKLIFRQEAFGFGDVKLCAAMGLVLGINGTIASIAAAVIISGFAAAAGLASGKYKKTDQKPMGPYLCGCAMAYILLVIGGGFTL